MVNSLMPRKLNRIEKKKRSIIRRFFSRFINKSNSYIIQYLPDFIFEKNIDFQLLRSSWIYDHVKNNDSDLVRLLFIIANVNQVIEEGVSGSIAELGVFKGNAAKVLSWLMSDRKIYLLDTYSGFSENDLTINEPTSSSKGDFNAGVDAVKSFVGGEDRIKYVQGYFPQTANKIPSDEKFCFVNIDVDLYEPIKAGLEYFYPRMNLGGQIIIHDYANSCWPGVKKAVDEFLINKTEKLIIIPDKSGTATFRKL